MKTRSEAVRHPISRCYAEGLVGQVPWAVLKPCLMVFLAGALLVQAVEIKRDSLDNGIIILTSEAHKIPLVEVRVVVRAGSFYDPTGKDGLANLTSQLMLRGARGRSGDEIAEMIESVGGELSPFTSEDHAGFYGRVLTGDLPLLIGLLNDCLRFPEFDSLEFMRAKRKMIARVRAYMDDPDYRGELEFRRRLFKDYPLNHFPEGDPAGMENINVKDIREFHAKHYSPGNAFIVVVGDFEPASLRSLLNAGIAEWERRETAIGEVGVQPAMGGRRGFIIKRDISQAYIYLGHPGPGFGATDWMDARLMNYVLGGGGLLTRIPAEVRDRRGLAYDARSYFSRYQHGGYFISSVQTKKESASEVVGILVDEMTKMKQGAKSSELEGAKKYYTGHFPLTFDTYREIASLIQQIEIEKLGLDYPDKFGDLVRGVALDQIRKAAERYLHPEAFVLVIVGDLSPEDIKMDGIEWTEILDDLD
jgi:zinc protease